MDLRSGTRLFVALLVVALPPLILFAIADFVAGEWLAERGYGAGTVLLIAVLLTVVSRPWSRCSSDGACWVRRGRC